MKQLYGILAVAALLAMATGTAAATLTTIYDIQEGDFNVGEEVTVQNVVVTASGRFGFFVQEQEPHPLWGRMFSGIWIFTNGDHMGYVHRGDVVDVTGFYDEYYDFSEIDVFHSPCGVTMDCGFEVVGTAEVPAPVEVAIADINDQGPYNEYYESVLVRVDSTDVSLFASDPDAYDEWWLYTDGVGQGDSLHVDLYSADPQGDFDYPLPQSGDEFTFLQGVLTYSYSSFKLAPRNCVEDMGTACPPVLRGMWAYDNEQVDVAFAVAVDQTSAENVDNYYFFSGLLVLDAARDPDNHRLVHLTTESQTPGYVDVGYAENILSEGDLVPIPAGQSFTFTQGLTPIYDIQFTDDLLEDDSPYLDLVVTVAGRVTHVMGNYYFLQEGDAGPFQHLLGRVARTGDLAVGDSVKFAGRVQEYYGSTYVGFTPGVNLYERIGPAVGPVVVTDLDASQMIYDADAGDGVPPDDNAPEPWEDALVHLNQDTVIDSVDGGGSYGEWWLLAGADTCMTDFDNDVNAADPILYLPMPGDSLRMTGILRYEYNTYRLVPRDQTDIEIIYGSGVGDEPFSRARLLLRQNEPNPFGRSTTIRFRLEQPAGAASVVVYDVTGARVRQLLDGAALTAGEHTLAWDGRDDAGAAMASGTYFYQLSVDGRTQAKQLMLLR